MIKLCRVFIISLVFAVLFSPVNSYSQDNGELAIDYVALSKDLSHIEENIRDGKISQDETSDYIRKLSDITNTVSGYKKEYDKNLGFVQKRLDALGDAPADGVKEAVVIAKNRKQFTTEANNIKSKIAEADVVLAKVDEIESLILNTRNQELLDDLMDKQPSLIIPSNFIQSTAQFAGLCFDIFQSPVKWYKDLNFKGKNEVRKNILPFSISFIICLIVAYFLRVLFRNKLGYRKGVDNPTYTAKIFAAIFAAIGTGVIPATIVGALIFIAKSHQIMTHGFFGLLLTTALYYLLYMILFLAIVKVILAKHHSKWRIFAISDEKALSLSKIIYFSVIAICITSFLQRVANGANYPVELIYYIRTIGSAIKALALVLITHSILCDESNKSTATNLPADTTDSILDEEGGELSAGMKATVFVSLFSAGVFSLSLFGYPNLSAYILNRTIFSLMIIAFLVVVSKVLIDIFRFIMSFQFWSKTFKVGKRKLSKLDIWFSIIVNPIIIIFGVFLLLGVWGVSTDILWQSSKKIFFGFSVGGIKISFAAILTGILVFFVTLALIKLFRGRVLETILDKMEVENSVKHSLSSGIGFLGIIIALLLAISVMGGSLNNIALIAGALSLGVGLGLQNIVNNFVSGIILLFERPITIGDWVIVNGEEGIVKQINIRATEIETWTKASVIIPNADILSTVVTNMTLEDKMGRIDIKIGVAYGSDVDKVKRILLEIAAANKRVTKTPAPYVVFADFGDSSLDFELRCYTSDVMNRLGISSEIRTEINQRFIEERIEIPFPQRVVHSVSQNTQFLDKMVNNQDIKIEKKSSEPHKANKIPKEG